MESILKAIDQVEIIYRLSDSTFATRLGVDRSLISQFRSGKAEPGVKFLRAFAREFPEAQLSVFQYLAGNDESQEKTNV